MAQLVEDLVLDASAGVHGPRNLDWKRAAALLYGDWGTSKAYVIGLAFLAAGVFVATYHSCSLRRDRARGHQLHRHLSSLPRWRGCLFIRAFTGTFAGRGGALLLVADWPVTAALGGWSAMSYVTSGAEDIDFRSSFARPYRAHNDRRAFGHGLNQLSRTEHLRSFAVALALPTSGRGSGCC